MRIVPRNILLRDISRDAESMEKLQYEKVRHYGMLRLLLMIVLVLSVMLFFMVLI